MILVIDFDKCIAFTDYPTIHKLKPNAKEVINRLHSEGHDIIINTCRAGLYEGQAYEFLEEQGVLYHYINCNLPRMIEEYQQDCRKISGDIYIDDKNLGGIPDDWEEIYTMIHKHKIKMKLE